MIRHRLLRQCVSRPGAALFAMLLLAAAPVLAQQAPQTPIFRAAHRSVNGGQMALLSTNRALSLDVNIAAFRQAAAPVMSIADVPLAPGLEVDLELSEWNIIEPGARMVFGTANGDVPITLTARLYKGKVKGDPKSDVFLSFSDKGVLGHVRTFDKSYEISTDHAVKQDGPTVAAISYPTDALPNKMVNCGVTDENMGELASPRFFEDFEKLYGGHDHELAADQIEFAVTGAWEADVEYLGLFGGDQQAAADYLAQLIGDVSSVYERDLGTQLTIGHLKIWTDKGAEGYPYKEGANMAIGLRETRDYWRKHDEVTRAFVHTFSGKGWVNPIGIAFLDVLCDNGRAGSFSAITRTDAARDRRVVAHEIGHNFSSPHTHDCSWPVQGGPGAIDHCAPAEGGSCFSTVEQSVGTIMSYCSQSNLEFHPLVRDRIRERLTTSACGGFSSARKLLIRPNRVIFGDVVLNKPRDTVFTSFFTNIGFGDIEVTGIEMTGEHVDQFEILEGGTDDIPFTLGPGDSTLIRVRYKAETTEPATLKLTYIHNGFNPPVEVTFEGYATDATPAFATVNLDEDEIDWGEKFQGLPNDTLFEVGNFGTGSIATPATLYVTETRIEGPDKLDFQIIQGSAPFQLAGGQKIEIGLRFEAGSTGDKQAELVVVSNSNGEEGHIDRIPLYGNAKVGPVMQLGVHDFIIDFGDVIRETSYVKEYDGFFKNAGGADLLGFTLFEVLQGEPDLFFTPTPGLDLLPGEDYDLDFTFFAPSTTTPGIKEGRLVVIGTTADVDAIEVSNDTIYVVANVVAPSAVPDDAKPDDYFYVTTSPATGSDLSFYLAPRDAERNDLYILSVVDIQGKEVFRKIDRFGDQGTFQHLDARNWPSGVYHIRVSTTQGIRSRKASLAR